jgi:valyl-tRNA synthetase
MDLRPQAHDIIRTWLFSTILRAELQTRTLPWRHVALSGWILDPDRKKMSKSRGNVVTPMGLLERFSPDAVRYWAASGRPGTDTAFDEGQMKVGRRLATKLLNASKFVLSFPQPAEDAAVTVTETLDRAMLSGLDEVIRRATAELEDFRYTTALEAVERFFWLFCDDYLELVKHRAYDDGGGAGTQSARLALRGALSVLHRLFAPFLPYCTEEVWSWWHSGSVHAEPWPVPAGAAEGGAVLALAGTAIGAIRKAKSDARRSMRSPVARVRIEGPEADLENLASVAADLRAAGNVADLTLEPATGPLRFDVTLPTETGG